MNQLSHDKPVQGPPAPAGSPGAAARAQPSRTPQGAEPRPSSPRRQPNQPDQANQPGQANQPSQPPRLSAAVLAQIGGALRQGSPEEPALATQADLVALHKRIGDMFTTLNEGLGAQYTAKAAADRAGLSARIDQLEEAVNRMEGALRIEFEPVLKAAMAEALAQARPAPRRRWRGRLTVLTLTVAALAAGVIWHAPLADLASQAATAATAQINAAGNWSLPEF